MRLFAFRTRRPERDRETDSERMRSLLAFLGELSTTIDRERNGLRNRLDRVRGNAAFSLEAWENGGGDVMSAKADAMTAAIKRCSERLAVLEGQAAFLMGLRNLTFSFADQAKTCKEQALAQWYDADTLAPLYSFGSRLPETLVESPDQRIEEVRDHRSAAELDLCRHRHSRK